MDQILPLGSFMAFNKVLVKTYTAPADDHIDIPTEYLHLDKDRTIVTANLTHLLDPHGGSARWKVEIKDKKIFGDAHEPQTLRIYFSVFVHGQSGVAIESIDFFGMIFAGAARNLGDMD